MGKWYLGTFVFSTFLLAGPVLALLFTPLFPVFLAAMVMPFVLRGIALNRISASMTDGAELKKIRSAFTVSMISGAVLGIPLWIAVVRILLNGRYL